MSLKLMLITNKPEIAVVAQTVGINRIFVDLEKTGKLERQGHLDTVISSHSLDDVSLIRGVIDKSKLLVRINPIHENSNVEIEEVISRGADILMLPMFKTSQEVSTFVKLVDGRARTCLLLETAQALVRIDQVLNVDGIDEIHIGLNDLHLSMGLDFMFELLSGGIIDYVCGKIKNKGIEYGFGGIAKLGTGQLPAEDIIKEHYRLGSGMVILSRGFFNNHDTRLNITGIRKELSLRVEEIRNFENSLVGFSEENYLLNNIEMSRKVCSIVENKERVNV